MIWQDIAISTAMLVFSISLIPQIHEGFKKKKGEISLATSTPTWIGLYIIGFVYVTLSLNYSAILSFLSGTLWLILFIQRLKYGEA